MTFTEIEGAAGTVKVLGNMLKRLDSSFGDMITIKEGKRERISSSTLFGNDLGESFELNAEPYSHKERQQSQNFIQQAQDTKCKTSIRSHLYNKWLQPETPMPSVNSLSIPPPYQICNRQIKCPFSSFPTRTTHWISLISFMQGLLLPAQLTWLASHYTPPRTRPPHPHKHPHTL